MTLDEYLALEGQIRADGFAVTTQISDRAHRHWLVAVIHGVEHTFEDPLEYECLTTALGPEIHRRRRAADRPVQMSMAF